jgi:hypothetical protein
MSAVGLDAVTKLLGILKLHTVVEMVSGFTDLPRRLNTLLLDGVPPRLTGWLGCWAASLLITAAEVGR